MSDHIRDYVRDLKADGWAESVANRSRPEKREI